MHNLKIANDELKWEKETVVGLDLEKLKNGYASLKDLGTDETDYWASVEFKDVENND